MATPAWTDIPEQCGVIGGGLLYIGIGEIRASPISDRADIGSDIGPISGRQTDVCPTLVLTLAKTSHVRRDPGIYRDNPNPG